MNGLTREYFPVKDEYFTVDRKPLQRYDEVKRKRFGFAVTGIYIAVRILNGYEVTIKISYI